ncbi:unannotated protein [freshwater metagenome]|uniref:Unannotated protein n=1 Tax=freshwater metagenome TaxID=449393 RepID=A0A6J6YHL0_9ZZZZ
MTLGRLPTTARGQAIHTVEHETELFSGDNNRLNLWTADPGADGCGAACACRTSAVCDLSN